MILRSRLHLKGLEAGLINAGVREQQVEAANGAAIKVLDRALPRVEEHRADGECMATRCHQTSRFRPCFLKAWAAAAPLDRKTMSQDAHG